MASIDLRRLAETVHVACRFLKDCKKGNFTNKHVSAGNLANNKGSAAVREVAAHIRRFPEGNGAKMLPVLMPLIEAICAIPEAFSQAASSRTTVSELISRWYSITVFSDVAVNLNEQICKDITILRRSGISEDAQRKIFHSTRILEPLPNLLQSRLMPLLDQPYTLGELTASIYSQFMLLAVGYNIGLTNILSSRDIILRATSGTLLHEDAAQFLSAIKKLVTDLLVATPPFLEASITKRYNLSITDTAFIYFNRGRSRALSLFAELEDEPTSDISRIGLPGTWVLPAIEGISAVLKKAKTETPQQIETEQDLYFAANLLVNTFHTCPNTPDWHLYEDTAATLAKPNIQKRLRKVLDSYSVWYATTVSDIDRQPTGRVNNSMGGVLIPEHRYIPVYGYAAMAEASLYHAISSGVTLDWSQVARNLIDCGDAWMALSSHEAPDTNAATTVLVRTFFNMLDAVDGIKGEAIGVSVYFMKNPIPFDEVVQLLGAVERLIAIAGSAPRFLSAPSVVGGNGTSSTSDLKLPATATLSLAIILCQACDESLVALTRDSLVDDEQQWQNAYEVSLGGLETVGKALMLFAAVPSLADRSRLLDDGSYHFTPELKDAHDAKWASDLSDLVSSLLRIVHLCATSRCQDGVDTRRFACGVLTMVQVVTAMGPLANKMSANTQRLIVGLASECDDVISNSILPSDLPGLLAIKERMVMELEEHNLSNYEALLNYLREHMIEVAEAADPKDLNRLKLRTEVIGTRRCSNLRCTTLRPSSKKPFGKFCEGCKVARYCGVECQRADWKAGHKIVCKHFEKMPL